MKFRKYKKQINIISYPPQFRHCEKVAKFEKNNLNFNLKGFKNNAAELQSV